LPFHTSIQRFQSALVVCEDIGVSFLYIGRRSCYTYE
jgi:hypothetical protein